MSELEKVYVMLAIALGVSAYFCWRWKVALDDLKWKSVECAHLESARAYFEKDRDSYRDGYARLTRYAHVRKIAANIIAGTARKK